MELAECPVVASHRTLALKDVDFDRGLVVRSGREDFALPRRNRRIALDQLGENAAECFNAERQRRHVEQQHIFHFAAKNAGLNRRADRNNFVRVHALVRFLAEEFPNDLLNFRNSRRAANKHNFINIAGLHARVLQRLLAGSDRTLKNVIHERLRTSRASASGSGASDRLHPP